MLLLDCRIAIKRKEIIMTVEQAILENVRSFPIDDYLIFYSPIAAGIEVLRVVSGYRDLESLFSE
jgi:plasmid stabilization system protein ParE